YGWFGLRPVWFSNGRCAMRSIVVFVLLCLVTFVASCTHSDPAGPVNAQNQLSMFATGRIIVHVYWANQGIAGKKAEVLGFAKVETSDENGIAVFRVPVGTFTVRVYDV